MYKEKRVSNKLKQKQLQTKYLEQQTKKMQEKLTQLKKQVQQQKKLKVQLGLDKTVTRWQKTTANATGPLKSYAKQILQQQKQAYNQFGINQKKITGSKAFEVKKIKKQKQDEQQRNPKNVATFFIEKQSEIPTEKVVLENNFFKAKMDIKKLIKQKTLEQFLQQNYILEYLSIFNQQGINDLQTLRYIQKDQLQEMGVKAGHQIKIIKKIKEQFDKMLQGKYQQTKPQISLQSKVQTGYGDGNVETYNTSQQLQKLSQDENKMPEQEQQDQDEYQQQMNDQVLITVPMHQISLQVNEQSPKNCYECYKIIANSVNYHVAEKDFCSQKCMQKYLLLLQKICPSCDKLFLKTQGYNQKGMWFCSLGCCPNHEQIQQLFFQWHRQH